MKAAALNIFNFLKTDVRQYGIKDDGSDQTANLVKLFTGALASKKGIVQIPYGVSFDSSIVYAPGVISNDLLIEDTSSINTGQPPGYKNKVSRLFGSDLTANDSIWEIASGHHPALRFLNLHNSPGSDSGAKSFHSILFAHGMRKNLTGNGADPIDGIQLLVSKSTRGQFWRVSLVLNTPFDYADAAALRWKSGDNISIGDKRNNTENRVYQATTAGVTGVTQPVGVTAGINDGGVTWNYLGPWYAGKTIMYLDEDGYFSIGNFKAINDGGDISGATPTLSTDFHTVNNTIATNMTDIFLPNGINALEFTLSFSTGLTTVMNTGGNFNLKGNVNVTPAAGSVMKFQKVQRLSGGITEVSRNF